MGLKPKEVKALTLKEFTLMLQGYEKREEKENDRTRNIMAFIVNYAGMGVKDFIRPEDIWPLSMDKVETKRKITTRAQALLLLKEFVKCQPG